MLRKILKTLFETQNTRFSRLKWVANKLPGLAAKTLKDKIVKNFLSVFRDWKVYPRESRELSHENLCVPLVWLDLSLANKSPKLTRELAAEFRNLDDPQLSRQNRATLFLKFFSFYKNKILSKNT